MTTPQQDPGTQADPQTSPDTDPVNDPAPDPGRPGLTPEPGSEPDDT